MYMRVVRYYVTYSFLTVRKLCPQTKKHSKYGTYPLDIKVRAFRYFVGAVFFRRSTPVNFVQHSVIIANELHAPGRRPSNPILSLK